MRRLCVLLFGIFLLTSIAAEDATPIVKVDMPDEATQKEMLQMVKELYEQTTDKDTDYAEHMADVLKTANGTKNPAEKLGLLSYAISVFERANDPEQYMAVVNVIDTTYKGGDDIWAGGYKTRGVSKDDAAEGHEVYGKLIDLSIKNGRIDNAMELAKAGIIFIRSKDRELNKDAVERMKTVRLLESSYKKVEPAMATLKTNPKDPEANGIVGKFKCFILGNWEEGLAHLAMADDEELKAVAGVEMLNPESAEHQASLADSWAKIAKQDRAYANAINQRAAMWYAKALPELKGVPALKAKMFLKNNKPKETASSSSSKPVKILKFTREIQTKMALCEKSPDELTVEKKRGAIRIFGEAKTDVVKQDNRPTGHFGKLVLFPGKRYSGEYETKQPSKRDGAHYGALLLGKDGMLKMANGKPASLNLPDGKHKWALKKVGAMMVFEVEDRGKIEVAEKDFKGLGLFTTVRRKPNKAEIEITYK